MSNAYIIHAMLSLPFLSTIYHTHCILECEVIPVKTYDLSKTFFFTFFSFLLLSVVYNAVLWIFAMHVPFQSHFFFFQITDHFGMGKSVVTIPKFLISFTLIVTMHAPLLLCTKSQRHSSMCDISLQLVERSVS